jgi:hypothetical protein
MIIPTLALAAALSGAVLQPDTVVPVDRGTRLDVDHSRGAVTVEVWDRDAVRVRAESGSMPEVARRGSILRIQSDSDLPSTTGARLSIAVPRWMDLEVRGQQLRVSVAGGDGEVLVENMSGDVRVRGGAGRVGVRTHQGSVEVRDARGRVEVRGLNSPVTVAGVTGDVMVEAINGGITIQGGRSANVRASTVNGPIRYDGAIQDGGRYAFTTHNGPIDMVVAEGANATVTAITYSGQFNAAFPLRLTGMTRDRNYNFTLGSGSARVELESFNGTITLRRP